MEPFSYEKKNMNPHAILGVANNASADDIKMAYRRLAMLHHPDRGGSEETFKNMKAAFDTLEQNGFRPSVQPAQPRQQQYRPQWEAPQTPGNTWRDQDIGSIFEEMKKANRGYPRRDFASRQPDGELVAKVSMREAYSGFNMQMSKQRNAGLIENIYTNIPPGTPHGYRGKYQMSDGSYQIIITKIEPGEFRLRGFADSESIFTAGLLVGDVEVDIDIDAIDMITGTWLSVKDFLGEELKVRVPAGFNPLQRLKVANKGYAGWSEEYSKPTAHRRDMYIKLRPVFKAPHEIDRGKIKKLYDSVGGWEDDAGNA